MKNGYKHKTTLFGTAAEYYASRLLMMIKNPNGDRRPDLVSSRGFYQTPFSVEVKSGAKMKGVLVDYQLHYSITSVADFVDLFGEEPPKREITTELFPTSTIQAPSRLLPGNPVAYYYGVLNRVDELGAKDLDRPYATLKCQWGDLFLVPSEFAFYSFVACRIKRTGEKDTEVITQLREMMKRDALNWQSANYEQRKGKSDSWQNIQGRDIKAVFEDDMSIATADGRDRINVISTNWDDFKHLKRIKINGPNNTSIYVLANPEDMNLFQAEIKKVVESRIDLIERVARARKRAISLINNISAFDDSAPYLFSDQGARAQAVARQTISASQINKLERLVKWLDKGETSLTANPF